MIISLKYREQFSGFLNVVGAELDNIIATLRAWSNVEHNDDGTHSPNVGNILQFMAGANIGAGQPVYVSAGADQTAAGQLFLADASSVSKSTQAAIVGLATLSVSAGANATVRDRGVFGGLVGLQAGKVYYLGTAPGSLTLTAPTNAVLIGLAVSTTELLILLRNPTIIAGQASLTWTGPTSGTQNMQTGTVLAFTAVGTYTLTVNSACTFSIKAAAGGGGGGGTSGNAGAGAGGGGGITNGTTAALVTTKSYTLVVGASGSGATGFATGTSGGSTVFANATDAITIIALAGGVGGDGAAGSPSAGGTGGAATTGTNLVSGGAGGAGGVDGVAGSCNANGAAGGGGGSQINGTPGVQQTGGAGGGSTGTTPSGGGGGLSGDGISILPTAGTGGGTRGNGGGVGVDSGLFEGGGGGGGGAGAAINSANYGGGGGGAGARGNNSFPTGGSGQTGVAVFTFVSAP